MLVLFGVCVDRIEKFKKTMFDYGGSPVCVVWHMRTDRWFANCQCQTFTDYVPAGSVMCRKPRRRQKVVQGYTQCMHSLIDLGN